MFLKSLLFPTFALGFRYDDLQSGHCPHQPGEIEMIDFDPSVLNGVWINVFDRKILNEHIKCYSARFQGFTGLVEDFENDDFEEKDNYFEYSTLSTEVPKYLNDTENRVLTARLGAQVNFQFHKSGSVGILEHSAINPTGNKKAEIPYESVENYSPFIWDAQFTRYVQVLETDEKSNFIVLYQCMEHAQFKDKESGKILTQYDAWRQTTRDQFDFSKRPIVSFKPNDSITVEPMYFQNIKILWRAANRNSVVDGQEIHVYPHIVDLETGPSEEKINDLKAKIFKKLPNEFPMDVLTNDYAWLDHSDESCYYNPSMLDDHKYIIESYGLRDDLSPIDGFFSKEIDNSGRKDEL